MSEQKPLSRDQINQLQSYFDRFVGATIQNLEMLDGFFVAIICCPKLIKLDEFIIEVISRQRKTFDNLEDADIFFDLVSQHWDHLLVSINRGDFLPIFKLENGHALGNDWANGFLHGMNYGAEFWDHIFKSKDISGILIPIFALAHEKSNDPDLQPFKEPLNADRRNHILAVIVSGVMEIYKYFRSPDFQKLNYHSKHISDENSHGYKQTNIELCYCGSGLERDHCCNNMTLH